MVNSNVSEINSRYDELDQSSHTRINYGGGTHYILTERDLSCIFESLSHHFTWSADIEITLEANPDDLNKPKLKALKEAGVNRLSIGIQSFDDQDLKFMNRAHNASEASTCIDLARDEGFEKLTADLIYGSPTTSDYMWKENIDKLLSYDLPHISAYCLTVEEGTALYHHVRSGKYQPVDQDKAIAHFEVLIQRLKTSGYDHYEISNFAKPGDYAVHNTNYWKGKPYLGIGPGAHSYDGAAVRRWNIAHNAKYIKAISEKSSYWDSEKLTHTDQYNEYILTALRTMWGLDITKLEDSYGKLWSSVLPVYKKLLSNGLVQSLDNRVTLTQEGKYLADNVSMQLFVEGD